MKRKECKGLRKEFKLDHIRRLSCYVNIDVFVHVTAFAKPLALIFSNIQEYCH